MSVHYISHSSTTRVLGTILKAEWKKIRDNFRDALTRSKLKGGQATKDVTKYRFYNQLSFLIPFITSKGNNRISRMLRAGKQSASIEVADGSVGQGMEIFTTNEQGNPIKDEIITGESPSVNKRRSRRGEAKLLMRTNDPLLRVEETHAEESGSKRARTQIISHQGDALKQFFDAMCESTRMLPFSAQLQVKKKVFQIVSDAEEECIK
uniref:MADF domain-containing protein n=1 Tax=Timema douglasi TaxID=61478 RepID=A0A7R8VCG5_TIMDO|nr:unnamed protein product [Timema douglasi]